MIRFGNIIQAVLICGVLIGQNQTVNAEDLIEIYKIAEQNDPQFAAVSASVMAIREQRIQARAGLLPDISFDANTTYNSQDIETESGFGVTGDVDFNSRGYHLKMKQPLFRYDRWLTLKQSEHRISRSEAELEAAFQQLMLRVAERYFGVLTARDNLGFSRAEKAALKRQFDQTSMRYGAGFIAETDVQEAKAAYNNSLAQEILAENDLDNAREALREIIGAHDVELDGVKNEISLINPNPTDVSEWTAFALESNPELIMAETDITISGDEVGIQKAGHLPSLEFVATTGRDIQGGRFGSTDTDATSAGLRLSIPLFSGGRVSSKANEAQYRHQQIQSLYEQQKRAVFRETRDAFLGIKSGISRVKALALSVESSISAQKATLAGYEAGTRTTVDVVAAERELFRARRDYSGARYDYILSILRLQKATGLLVPTDLKMVNSWLEKGKV